MSGVTGWTGLAEGVGSGVHFCVGDGRVTGMAADPGRAGGTKGPLGRLGRAAVVVDHVRDQGQMRGPVVIGQRARDAVPAAQNHGRTGDSARRADVVAPDVVAPDVVRRARPFTGVAGRTGGAEGIRSGVHSRVGDRSVTGVAADRSRAGGSQGPAGRLSGTAVVVFDLIDQGQLSVLVVVGEGAGHVVSGPDNQRRSGQAGRRAGPDAGVARWAARVQGVSSSLQGGVRDGGVCGVPGDRRWSAGGQGPVGRLGGAAVVVGHLVDEGQPGGSVVVVMVQTAPSPSFRTKVQPFVMVPPSQDHAPEV